MAHSPPAASLDAQVKASTHIADAIVAALTTERGAHAETVVTAAARIAGTFLFRSFGLKTASIPPGSPVLSDVANERGPVLVEVLTAGLAGLNLQVPANAIRVQTGQEHQPQLTFLETQQALEPQVAAIAAAHGLAGESAARACALATALLVHRTKSVLDPTIAVGLAVYGFVEGTKTMPGTVGEAPPQSKPWYKVW